MFFSVISVIKDINNTFFLSSDSLAKQTYQNYEHIIVVKNSSLNSLAQVKLIKTKNKKFFIQKKGNLYNAINLGISKSLGDYIFLLHSGDLIPDKNLLKEVSKIIKKRSPNLIIGNIKYFNQNISNITRVWKPNLRFRKFYNFGWHFPHTSMFIEKNTHRNIGDYNENYQISSDYDYVLRILKNSKIKYEKLEKDFVLMEQGGLSSNFKIDNLKKKFYEDLRIRKKNNIKPFLIGQIFKILYKFIQTKFSYYVK